MLENSGKPDPVHTAAGSKSQALVDFSEIKECSDAVFWLLFSFYSERYSAFMVIKPTSLNLLYQFTSFFILVMKENPNKPSVDSGWVQSSRQNKVTEKQEKRFSNDDDGNLE